MLVESNGKHELSRMKLELSIGGHTDMITAILPIQSHRSTSLFATASKDATIKLWNADTGICIHTLLSHKSQVNTIIQMEWEHKDLTLLSGSDDESIIIWDLTKGKPKAFIPVADKVKQLQQMKSSIVNQSIVISLCQANAIVWDLETQSSIKVLEIKATCISPVSLEEFPQLIAACQDSCISLWSVEDGHCYHILRESHMEADIIITMHWPHHAFTLVSAGKDKKIRRWDYKEITCVKTISAHSYEITCIAQITWEKNDSTIMSIDVKSIIKLWDLITYDCVKVIENCACEPVIGIFADCFKTNRKESVLILGGKNGKIMKLFNLADDIYNKSKIQEDTLIAPFPYSKSSSSFIASANSKKKLQIWSFMSWLDSFFSLMNLLRVRAKRVFPKKFILFSLAKFCSFKKELKQTIHVQDYVRHIVKIDWSRNAFTFALSFPSSVIKIFDLNNTTQVSSLEIEGHTWLETIIGLSYVKWTKNDTTLLELTIANLYLWNIETAECFFVFPFDNVSRILFPLKSETNDSYVLSHNSGKIIEFNLTSQKIQRQIKESSNATCMIQLYQFDGFALGTSEGIIDIWNQTERKRVLGHLVEVLNLNEVVLPSVHAIVSAGGDNTVKIWNVESAICFGTYEIGRIKFKQMYVLFSASEEIEILGSSGGNLYVLRLFFGKKIPCISEHRFDF